MKRALILVLFLAGGMLLQGCAVGLKPWSPGTLDIHCINTGRGESTFFVFPDGTTMLVDAAGSTLKKHKHMPTPPKPDSTTTSGRVIIDYIHHFAPKAPNASSPQKAPKGSNAPKGPNSPTDPLDWFVLTHYHADHMGELSKDTPMHPKAGFRLTSLCEVGSEIPIRHFLSRGDPTEVKSSGMTNEKNMANLAKFLNWTRKANGTRYDFFEPAADDQIHPVHKPVKDFTVRNIAANGRYRLPGTNKWATDIPEKAVLDSLGDPKAYPGENVFSTAFILSYGPFDYFGGGDLQYSNKSLHPYFDIEEQVSRVCSKVEVMKASHHCTKGANGQPILDALRPDAVVAHVWRDVQPNPETLGRVYKASPACRVFLTNLSDSNKPVIAEYLDRIQSTSGHILIRVSRGGRKYTIYTLDDTNPGYRVTGRWGPYKCK